MKKTVLQFLILAIILRVNVFAQAGNLDSTFGINGKVTGYTEISNFDKIVSLIVEPDGRIAAVGASDIAGPLNCAWDLIVYHVDGSIDFKVVGNFDQALCTSATCVATEIDGEFLLGGEGWFYGSLAKFKVNGSVDSTFGVNGQAEIPSIWAVLLITTLPESKILIAGLSSDSLELIRLNSNGSIDSSFANGGLKTSFNYNFGFYDFGHCMNVKSDGKILLAGNSGDYQNENFALAQYNSDGTPDTAFGAGGVVSTGFDLRSTIINISIDSNEKIMAAGLTGPDEHLDAAFARYNSDGSIDSAYGINGKVVTPTTFSFYSAAFQQDGKSIFAGAANNFASFALTRYQTNGSPDSSFGEQGSVTTEITPGGQQATSVAVGADGKIVAGGYANGLFALARYISGLDVGIIDLSSPSTNSILIYPNPIQQTSTLEYTLKNPETVSIHLLDAQGKILKTFIENEKQNAGEHQEEISFPDQLPSGFYFLTISSIHGGSVSVKVVR